MLTRSLDELFEVNYGNKLDFNKMKASESKDGVNFVSRSSENNGVVGIVERLSDITPYQSGLITVSLGGTKLLSAFIQQREFYTAQNIAVLVPRKHMTFEQKLFICVAIRHNRFRYSAFGREANRTIKKLEVPALSEMPEWLSSAQQSVRDPLVSVVRSLRLTPKTVEGSQDSIGCGRVAIESLFEVSYGTALELNKMKIDNKGINFVARTAKNNGISARIAAVEGIEPMSGPALSVAAGGSVLETFLQLEPFYSGYHLFILKPSKPMTNDELIFYCCCIRANKFRYSYGRQANRTIRQLMVPSREAIPAWVYGAFNSCTMEVEAIINDATTSIMTTV